MAERKPAAGAVEKATRAELRRLRATESALGQNAILMARWADRADSPTTAAQAARELRMTMTNVRGLANVPTGDPGVDEENVVPPSRLAKLRKEAAARGR